MAVCAGEHAKQLLPPLPDDKFFAEAMCCYENFVSKRLGNSGESCVSITVAHPIHTPGRVGEVLTVVPGCAGGVTKGDQGAETGNGRAAVLDWAFLGSRGRKMATIGNYTSACEGLLCEKFHQPQKWWKQTSKVGMLKPQHCCRVPASSCWLGLLFPCIRTLETLKRFYGLIYTFDWL